MMNEFPDTISLCLDFCIRTDRHTIEFIIIDNLSLLQTKPRKREFICALLFGIEAKNTQQDR